MFKVKKAGKVLLVESFGLVLSLRFFSIVRLDYRMETLHLVRKFKNNIL